jgi:hypothetical protein
MHPQSQIDPYVPFPESNSTELDLRYLEFWSSNRSIAYKTQQTRLHSMGGMLTKVCAPESATISLSDKPIL